MRARRATLTSQQHAVLERIDRLGLRALDSEMEQDDHARMLKHSARVRETLGRLRTRIVGRHTETIESLMLESFRSLLRKTDLVRGLHIDPATFAPTLTGNDSKLLPFDRLSAGERQLLATAMLWGLARASGPPHPDHHRYATGSPRLLTPAQFGGTVFPPGLPPGHPTVHR